ncbi:T9SS type A sorting domain-containing protein [Dyadobacter flavalbus]|uniref:T9SS type A sorting domain-containing protein n=1 Tax=Dyadobacter flavalbus TaxID=2579942 RepID=A0A5M8QY92_9BACT|nr:T9SS type A sorting domain-containing protein [Dyadobacter flavalbus]KAA6441159.1 T9SS type A sorting domain-containing protein [Dyadobacter flavalbus]
MKFKLLLFTLFVNCSYLKAQNCSTDYVLTSQQSIDDFPKTPDCAIGNLKISGADITNLDGLSGIKEINGYLDISINPLLTNVNGLSGLTKVSGYIEISNNKSLVSLAGLESLAIAGNSIKLANNAALKSISALSKLTTIKSSLEISKNDVLPNLNGFGALAQVFGYVEISQNPLLTSLSGLESLQMVGGNLRIAENNVLKSFSSLDSLTNINGFLEISNNAVLKNMQGLSRLSKVLGYININNNPLLVDLSGLESLTSAGGNLRIAANDALKSIASLQKLTTINGLLSIGRNASLPDLHGLEGINAINSAVAIAANDSLKNLDGLSGVTYIGGFVYIGRNPALTSLAGLNKLTTISGYLNIEDNDALTNLAGLDNINNSSIEFLQIKDNDQLAICGVKSICQFLTSGTNYNLEGNAPGCASQTEVASSSSCQTALPVDLVSFTGKSSVEGNIVSWQTASETNNAGFLLEKSSDARTFEELAFLKGQGNSRQLYHYRFADPNPFEITYYRLRQTDLDNAITYSRIISVKQNAAQHAVKIFPNPANGELFIEAENRNLAYSIRNNNGITVKEAAVLPAKPLDTSELENGLYLITIGSEVFRVIISN